MLLIWAEKYSLFFQKSLWAPCVREHDRIETDYAKCAREKRRAWWHVAASLGRQSCGAWCCLKPTVVCQKLNGRKGLKYEFVGAWLIALEAFTCCTYMQEDIPRDYTQLPHSHRGKGETLLIMFFLVCLMLHSLVFILAFVDLKIRIFHLNPSTQCKNCKSSLENCISLCSPEK